MLLWCRVISSIPDCGLCRNFLFALEPDFVEFVEIFYEIDVGPKSEQEAIKKCGAFSSEWYQAESLDAVSASCGRRIYSFGSLSPVLKHGLRSQVAARVGCCFNLFNRALFRIRTLLVRCTVEDVFPPPCVSEASNSAAPWTRKVVSYSCG